jgi:dihydropyrimidine dehydrogenase (NAD+) subunit PreA
LPEHITYLTPDMVQAASRATITTTPIPKLDMDGAGSLGGSNHTPLARIPRVDEHHCVGCNLCSLVCPVPECITMVEVENGLEPITWAERMAAGYVPPGVVGPNDLNT